LAPDGGPERAPGDAPGRVAAVLTEAADLLEAFGENPHRVRAYRQGAAVLLAHRGEFAARLAAGTLSELPGIGPELSAKAAEIAATGGLKSLDDLKGRVPAEVAALTAVPGVDGKTAIYLASRLHVHTVAHLRQLAATHMLRTIAWLGEEGGRRIEQALAEVGGA
jgi:DNA polymerase/3'-5' exonuclease PolX